MSSFEEHENGSEKKKAGFSEILTPVSKQLNWRTSLVENTLTVYHQSCDTYFEEISPIQCKMEVRVLLEGMSPSLVAAVTAAVLEEKDRLIDAELFNETRRNCIGFLNGVFDLRTGKMRRYQPSDYILSPLPHSVPMEVSAKTEKWFLGVLESWVGVDSGKWFADLLAYYLFVFPNHENLWSDFFGQGSNGKSVCLQLLSKILGDEKCIGCDLQNLNRFSGDSFRNRWLVLGRDSSEFVSDKATSFIKTYTGDERLLIEKKGGASFDVTNPGKLIVSTNHLIKSKDRSYAWYRRLLPIHFPFSFKPDEAFKDALFLRIPEIIRCLLHRAHLYKHNRTSLLESCPLPVKALREETRKTNDRIMAFWESHFFRTIEEPNKEPRQEFWQTAVFDMDYKKMKEVYDIYAQWHCEEYGDLPIEPSLTSFGGQYGAFLSSPAGQYFEYKRMALGRLLILKEEYKTKWSKEYGEFLHNQKTAQQDSW